MKKILQQRDLGSGIGMAGHTSLLLILARPASMRSQEEADVNISPVLD